MLRALGAFCLGGGLLFAAGLWLTGMLSPAPTGAVVSGPVISAATSPPVAAPPAPTTPPSTAAKTQAVADASSSMAPAGSVVCIDAGHQGLGDNTLEPIGPGSATRKASVSSGTSGVVTRVHESVVNLEVAKLLRSELEARGVRVVMVRVSEKVDIPNSGRAHVANAAKADLFVRLHCDGTTNHSTRGLSTLVPAKNQWTAPILSASRSAGRLIHAAAIATTGAADRGVVTRSDLAGFNWSTVPTVLVEMGFMSNSAEDRVLNDVTYQEKLARGLADGVVEYLRSK